MAVRDVVLCDMSFVTAGAEITAFALVDEERDIRWVVCAVAAAELVLPRRHVRHLHVM